MLHSLFVRLYPALVWGVLLGMAAHSALQADFLHSSSAVDDEPGWAVSAPRAAPALQDSSSRAIP